MTITFTHNQKEYSGELRAVAGSGGNKVYHLLIDNFYQGQLIFTTKWVFHSNKFGDISDQLVKYLPDSSL